MAVSLTPMWDRCLFVCLCLFRSWSKVTLGFFGWNMGAICSRCWFSFMDDGFVSIWPMVVINLYLWLMRGFPWGTWCTHGLCPQWLMCQATSESVVDQPAWACVTREGSLHCPDSVLKVRITLCPEPPYLALAEATGEEQKSPGSAPLRAWPDETDALCQQQKEMQVWI